MKYIYQNLIRLISQLLILCGGFLILNNLSVYAEHGGWALLVFPVMGLPGLILWQIGRRAEKRLKAKQAKSFDEAYQKRADEIQSGAPTLEPAHLPFFDREAPLQTTLEILGMGAILVFFIGAPWYLFIHKYLKDMAAAYGVLAVTIGLVLFKWAGWTGRLPSAGNESPQVSEAAIESCVMCVALRVFGVVIVLTMLALNMPHLLQFGSFSHFSAMLVAALVAVVFFAIAHLLQKMLAKKRKKIW